MKKFRYSRFRPDPKLWTGFLAVMLFAMTIQANPVTFTWVGTGTADDPDGINDRFNRAANWSPSGGPPGEGDIGNIGGQARVEIPAAGEMRVGATITLSDSAFIERNSNARAEFDGTLTFNDDSYLRLSTMQLHGNVALNWDSTGSWTTAPAGASSVPMFEFLSDHATSAATVNMSNGSWSLTSGGATAFRQDVGTFNMTGGTIDMDKAFVLGSGNSAGTFNLGGTGVIYTTAFDVFNNDSIFNFQGSDSALSIIGVGSESQLETRVSNGRVYIDGEQQSNMDNFTWSVINYNDEDYTRISVIPEPTVGALLLGLVVGAMVLGRRRSNG